jgi:hypothetical protein
MYLKKFFANITNWEKWPFALLYAPIGIVWLWYCIRSRSVWFFSASNPTISFGGFEGESKKEMYEQLPPATYPHTMYLQHSLSFSEVQQHIRQAGFTYPFIVKPDVGMKGILFRKIDNEEQLKRYHQRIPVEYIVQQLIEMPVEVSVFYYRYPNEQKGTISGFIQKELLEVVGDGTSTLWQLILQHPRAKQRLPEMKRRHEHRLHRVLSANQHFYLSYAGNHNRGARFINLFHLVDDEMLKLFDELSHYSGKFYYGRYDIKCQSVEALKAGKGYSILEFNGAGAEPNHIYDAGIGLAAAYKEILLHWKVLYQISKYNHQNGSPYWSFTRGWKYLQQSNKHFKALKKFD